MTHSCLWKLCIFLSPKIKLTAFPLRFFTFWNSSVPYLLLLLSFSPWHKNGMSKLPSQNFFSFFPSLLFQTQFQNLHYPYSSLQDWSLFFFLDIIGEILESCYNTCFCGSIHEWELCHAWRVRDPVHVMSFNLYNNKQSKIQHSGEQHYGPGFLIDADDLFGGHGHVLFCCWLMYNDSAFSGVSTMLGPVFEFLWDLAMAELVTFVAGMLKCIPPFDTCVTVEINVTKGFEVKLFMTWACNSPFSTQLQYYHV